MTDKPILFSGPMVRAILDGRKSQTRRVLKKPTWAQSAGWPEGVMNEQGLDGRLQWFSKDTGCACDLPIPQPGDRLWVREAWRTTPSLDAVPPAQIIARSQEAGYRPGWCPLHFEADGTRLAWSQSDWPGIGDTPGRFRQGMHMPRPLSRLTLTVTDVRVQRVQDISPEDAISEGLVKCADGAGERWWSAEGVFDGTSGCPVEAFRALWDSLNENRGFGWDANPWVVAISFDAHRCNIDQMERP